MANKLTKKQREFLDKQPKGLLSWDNMESQDFEYMMHLSNHETLLADIDRYLWDKAMRERFGD